MYRVVTKLKEENSETRPILAENLEELRAIVTFAEEGNYEILIVEKVELEYGKEFIKEITDKIQPDNLEYGKEENNDS